MPLARSWRSHFYALCRLKLREISEADRLKVSGRVFSISWTSCGRSLPLDFIFREQPTALTGFALAAVADAVMSASLAYYLHRSRTGFKRYVHYHNCSSRLNFTRQQELSRSGFDLQIRVHDQQANCVHRHYWRTHMVASCSERMS